MKAIVLFLTLTFVYGCAEDNSKTSRVGAGNQKPLPQCFDLSTLGFALPTPDQVIGYEVSWGYYPQYMSETHRLSEKENSLTIAELDRGLTYHYQIKIESRFQSWNRNGSVYIPKCEERDQWVKDNPKYTEPVVVEIEI